MAKTGNRKRKKGPAPRRKHEGESRADRQRRGRNLGLWILGALALLLAFYYVDRSGEEETLEASVVDTGTYDHSTQSGTHTHVEATLEYEGHRYTARPADNVGVGDTVRVNIRRGRFSGYPYYDSALGLRAVERPSSR